MTKLFEHKLAEFVGAKWAVSFNSATSALYACYAAAGLSPQDRVLSTANTFIATLAAPLQQKIKPQFIDLEKNSSNMDLSHLAEPLSQPATRGRYFIVPVHFAGVAIDMKKLERQVRSEDAVIIEDAAHAIGSFYPTGEKVGSCTFSQMTVFSFHPAKNMTTGEGGMVTTNDERLYKRLKNYRNNGIIREKPELVNNPEPGYYEIHELGSNLHMTEMQAALGISQLSRLEQFIEKRRTLVKRYRENLKDLAHVTCTPESFDERTAYHLMQVRIDFKALGKKRVDLMKALAQKSIGTEVHYIPIYRLGVYQNLFGDISHKFIETENYYENTLSLPLYYDLALEDVDMICMELKNLLITK